MYQAAFSIGQVIVHKKFNYRGVIFDVDAEYSGTEEWYQRVAKSKPSKYEPWYHVLVDGQLTTTYVAEKNLQVDLTDEPIVHPLTEDYFESFKGGIYHSFRNHN